MSIARLNSWFGMNKFFKNQRENVAVVAFLLVLAILVYFIIIPLISRINRTSDEIEKSILQQEIAEKQLEKLPKMKEQYEYILAEEEKINVLFDRNNAVALIEKLERIAQDSGSSIEISVQETAAKASQLQVAKKNVENSAAKKNAAATIKDQLPSDTYLQMKILLIGEYKNVVSFIAALENFEYYCDIISIQVNEYEEEKNQEANKNIFAPVEGSAEIEPKDVIMQNKLEATLDTVFYTKN